jgi:hypothetical protein
VLAGPKEWEEMGVKVGKVLEEVEKVERGERVV